MSRRIALLSVSMLTLGACSLFTSLDGLQDGAPAGSTLSDGSIAVDGSTDGSMLRDGDTLHDGSTLPDGSDGDSSRTNLLQNGSFEEAVLGCGGTWNGGYGASYTLVGDAHTGSQACMVCPLSSTESGYALRLTNPLMLGPGAYHAEAWIRAPLDAGAANAAGVLPLALPPDGGTVYYQGSQVRPDVVWAESVEDFNLTDSPTSLTVIVQCYDPNDGGCFVVDDVALYGP